MLTMLTPTSPFSSESFGLVLSPPSSSDVFPGSYRNSPETVLLVNIWSWFRPDWQNLCVKDVRLDIINNHLGHCSYWSGICFYYV